MATKFKLTLLFFILAFPVFAQTQNYYISDEDGFPRIIQRLMWIGGEYSLRYEIFIDILEGEEYFPYLAESSEEQFIEVSLPPGEYRFQVIPYDALNRPGEESEWARIRVLPYQEESPVIEPEPEPEPKERWKFNDYFYIIAGAAWKPSALLYGLDVTETVYPSGAEARLNLFYAKPILNFNPGAEVAVSWLLDENEDSVIDVGINLIIMKWSDAENIAVSIKAGVSAPLDFALLDVVLGGTFHWRVFGGFLLEAGVDYCIHGFIQPRLGFAFKF